VSLFFYLKPHYRQKPGVLWPVPEEKPKRKKRKKVYKIEKKGRVLRAVEIDTTAHKLAKHYNLLYAEEEELLLLLKLLEDL
jgi:hypothetical protein